MLIGNFKIGQLELRNLKPGEDNLNNYLNWMKNEKNNFIESVRPSWNLQELSNFVEKCNSSDSCVLLGVFLKVLPILETLKLIRLTQAQCLPGLEYY